MLDCIVIGAGPGGLACTKELLEQGVHKVICLEKADNLGGVFLNAYDSLRLTSSTTMSMFSDFWVGDGNENRFWTKQEAVAYWTRYANHFGVLEHIRFNAKVEAVIPNADETWDVQLASGETLTTKRMVLAIGNNAIPSYPAWKNALTDVEYSHSQDYRNADRFAGKNVLVVGGGESGSDVALEASRVAKTCWVSLRSATGWVVPRKRGDHVTDISTHRGLWGLPREHGKVLTNMVFKVELSKQDPVHDAAVTLNKKVTAHKGIWGTYGTKTFSLPKAIAHHSCKVVGEVLSVEEGGRTLRTADGETLQDIDIVVFCTGYKNYVSFLPEEIRQTDPRSLYKHMFHPHYQDKLAWIGWARPGFGSQFPIMEMQARLFAMICTGARTLPTSADMERITCLDRAANLEQFEHNAHRIRSLVDYHHYMDDLADLIGCQPPLWQYFFFHPRLWLHMMYGSTQATQFRLRGPGKKTDLAQELLGKMPVSTFNHVVKAGLRGRVWYAFKTLVPANAFVGFKGLRKSSPLVATPAGISD